MTRVADHSKMSAAEYLAWEREQPTKHEFFHGEVFAMAGGSRRHNLLCGAVIEGLRQVVRSRGCAVYTSDQRVSLSDGDRYVYPDVSVSCGVANADTPSDLIVDPAILVEVLSKSTENYDRGLKWEAYRQLGSLTDYILISQASVQVEHYRRQTGNHWDFFVFGSGDRIVLANGAELEVDAIYDGAFAVPGDS